MPKLQKMLLREALLESVKWVSWLLTHQLSFICCQAHTEHCDKLNEVLANLYLKGSGSIALQKILTPSRAHDPR